MPGFGLTAMSGPTAVLADEEAFVFDNPMAGYEARLTYERPADGGARERWVVAEPDPMTNHWAPRSCRSHLAPVTTAERPKGDDRRAISDSEV
jgi:hypothetical protein